MKDPKDRALASGCGSKRIAYGVVTEYPNQGKVEWVAFDAFCDASFSEVLLRHFWTHQGFYSCSTLSDSEDEISFTTSLETTVDSRISALDHNIATKVQRNGDVEINCGQLKLFVPRVPGDLPAITKIRMEEVGRIKYKSENCEVPIGILYQQP